ncbi:MAG: type II secretion system protein [Candidatus Paceibacterota bacterium]|jgi:prepilin-type N-terminal cleavage/methylation domain-containing protein
MKKSGFTLIELLVVIAIIGILASVVLASLNSARLKGADAGIKSDLTSIRIQSSIWYDDNGQVYATPSNDFALNLCPSATTTGNIFADEKIFSMVSAAYELAGGRANSQCVALADSWAVAVQLKTFVDNTDALPDSWCTDSVGSSRSYTYASGEDIADAITIDTCSSN